MNIDEKHDEKAAALGSIARWAPSWGSAFALEWLGRSLADNRIRKSKKRMATKDTKNAKENNGRFVLLCALCGYCFLKLMAASVLGPA